jgi:hypothetical protein
MPQQAVSADIILLEIFCPKTEGTKDKSSQGSHKVVSTQI